MEEKRSSVQSWAEFLVLLAVTLGGLGSAPLWIAVPGGAVLLLWIADRGQHRALAAVTCAGAYALGRLCGWLFAG